MKKPPFIAACFGSLILSLFIYARLDVINPDAICYLLSAKVYGQSGLHTAMQLCGQATWPFYSLMIYAMTTLTHLPAEFSAFFMNAVFSAISVCAFLAIVRAMGGNQRVLWLAALTILLAHDFNSVRQYIIRDHGFWACYLLSFYAYLRFFQTHERRYAVCWNVAMLGAVLFRIEAIIFLMLLPFFAFFQSALTLKNRFASYCYLNVLTIFCGVIGLFFLLMHGVSLTHFGRMQEITLQFTHGYSELASLLHTQKTALAKHFLSSDGARDAGTVLALLYPAWYVASVIQSVSLVYALLIFYGMIQKKLKLFLPMIAYLTVNIAITFIFLIERQFLSKRYLLALSLILMLYVPFVLDALYQRKRRLFVVAVIAIVLTSLGGMFNLGHSKTYMRQAGAWLALHAPQHTPLYSNDLLVLYYSNHYGEDIFSAIKRGALVTKPGLSQRGYLAIRVTQDNRDTWAKQSSVKPVTQFKNKSGDSVEIYARG